MKQLEFVQGIANQCKSRKVFKYDREKFNCLLSKFKMCDLIKEDNINICCTVL